MYIHTHNLVKLINCYAVGMHSLWDLLNVGRIAVPKKSKQTFLTTTIYFVVLLNTACSLGELILESKYLKLL